MDSRLTYKGTAMTRLNARQKAWRKVGDAFATPETNDINDSGLCWALNAVTRDNRLYWETFHLTGIETGLHWVPSRIVHWEENPSHLPEHDTCRALFAYLMSELTDDEYRAIGGRPELFEKGSEK